MAKLNLDALGFDEVWLGEHHSAGSEIISCSGCGRLTCQPCAGRSSAVAATGHRAHDQEV